MNEINPLKQYFRRPAMYLKLPSGNNFYNETIVNYPPNGELPIFPMTAIDEVTSRTPDALYNGIAVAELITSCVPNILAPWEISSIDIDAILVAIRAASVGSEMDIETTCPSCEEQSKFGLNLMSLLGGIKMADYNEPIVMGELSIKLRPLSLKELNSSNQIQFEIQRTILGAQSIEDEDEKLEATTKALESVNELSITVIAAGIESITTPEVVVDNPEFIKEFLMNCERKAFEKLRDLSIEMRQQSEIKPLKIKCIHCQHDYEQPFTLNVTDFFV
jgi:hypothetical protein